MLVVCIVLAAAVICLGLRQWHVSWQIKNINHQITFMNTHKTNKIVTGEYGRGAVTELINNINTLSRQCDALQAKCIADEDNIRETITNISHDIRTPLTSLSGYFQLLCQCDDRSEKEKYEKIIRQ